MISERQSFVFDQLLDGKFVLPGENEPGSIENFVSKLLKGVLPDPSGGVLPPTHFVRPSKILEILGFQKGDLGGANLSKAYSALRDALRPWPRRSANFPGSPESHQVWVLAEPYWDPEVLGREALESKVWSRAVAVEMLSHGAISREDDHLLKLYPPHALEWRPVVVTGGLAGWFGDRRGMAALPARWLRSVVGGLTPAPRAYFSPYEVSECLPLREWLDAEFSRERMALSHRAADQVGVDGIVAYRADPKSEATQAELRQTFPFDGRSGRSGRPQLRVAVKGLSALSRSLTLACRHSGLVTRASVWLDPSTKVPHPVWILDPEEAERMRHLACAVNRTTERGGRPIRAATWAWMREREVQARVQGAFDRRAELARVDAEGLGQWLTPGFREWVAGVEETRGVF